MCICRYTRACHGGLYCNTMNGVVRSLSELELQGYLAHKKRTPLGPYCRPMPRVIRGS